MKVFCYKCKKELKDFEKNISRNDECPHCATSIKCCKMCKLYDLSAYNQCRESSAERVLDKEKANFCDYFVLSSNQEDKDIEKKDDLLEAASAIFKD